MQENKRTLVIDEIQGIPLRMVRCPKCGFYLLDVYGYDHYYVRVKCRKCKFDEVIDTALFRTKQNKKRLFSAIGKRVTGH